MRPGFAVPALVLAILAGCATWAPVSGPVLRAPDGTFQAAAPRGWMRLVALEDRVLITRDGLAVQSIELIHRPHEQGFPALERVSAPDMLPSELAELTLAELRAGSPGTSLEVLENRPARVAGRPGFVVGVSFRTARGLEYRRRSYGVADTKGIYTLSFQAPRLHFYAAYRPVFEATVASFRIRDGEVRSAASSSVPTPAASAETARFQ